jgi:signal transduction histidine kinase
VDRSSQNDRAKPLAGPPVGRSLRNVSVVSSPGSSVETALRRAVILFRLLAVAWMAVMIAITVVSDPGASRPVIGATFLLAVTGAIWSVGHLASDRPLTSRYLAIEAVIGLVVALAPQLAGARDAFFGGYPMSVVVVFGFARGTWSGLVAAAVFVATQSVAFASDALSVPWLSDLLSLSVMAGVVAVVVGVGTRTLRMAELGRIEAEAALESERRRHAVDQARLEERVAVADDLHDSLLQTVRVISHDASDPERVRSLARRQERELRSMIERMHGGGENGVAAGLREAAGDVEDLFGVTIDVVASGDAPLGDPARDLVRSAREAMVNAARHSGASTIDVTLEVRRGLAAVVVRDRGSGFDPGSEEQDGHGLAALRSRLEKLGGSVSVTSAPGQGSELVLSVPLGGS